MDSNKRRKLEDREASHMEQLLMHKTAGERKNNKSFFFFFFGL